MSEARFRLALKAVRQGAWEFDLRTNEGYRSPELVQLLGVQQAHPTLSDFLSNVWPDDRPLVVQTFGQLRRGERDESVLQFRYRRDDGQTVWVEQHTLVERDEYGEACRLYGLSRDITLRKQAEQDLQQLNATLEARVAERTRELEAAAMRLATQNAALEARTMALEGFAELARGLTMQADPQVLLRRALEFALSVLPEGYGTYSQLEDGLWRTKVLVGNRRNAELQQVMEAGVPYDMMPSLSEPWSTRQPLYQAVYAPGSDLDEKLGSAIHALATLPVLVKGEPVGILGVVLFEQRPWAHVDKVVLETVARSLGVAMENARGVAELAQRTQELERSNQELEQFAYIASHDLQAPLRAVTSFAQLISDRYGALLDERGQVYLRQIVSNGQHMKHLVDDLLAFSRLHTQRRALKPISSAAVLATVVERLKADIEALGAQVAWDSQALPSVLADRGQLDSLLQNLLQNALKYHRSGVAPHVRVSAERDAGFWRFAVTDNGIGIGQQHFERVFEIFQRLHSRAEYEGTGIGLAVCKRIVEGHGGHLWLESTPGAGSTFYFTLPAVPVPEVKTKGAPWRVAHRDAGHGI
ncbi:PAS domain S-box [Deinococcus peraridilitoris DSM 19664]|uniref:histidine kinase n=2 Tax=Deinococcus TaxID=1298 RepID=L0A404_DEIPD|nr:PAS domain S-box [Deinococcus peraridilitoris DSM 19664]